VRDQQRSKTSDWVAALRAIYSEVPQDMYTANDPFASRLLPLGLRSIVKAAGIAPSVAKLSHRVIGRLTLGVSAGVPLRTAAIDAVVRDAVADGASQLVLLGAGLDARAWRMPELSNASVFELDHPATQAYKRDRVAQLEAKSSDVRFGSLDFERRSIADALADTQFDTKAKSVWVWEGVTMYLTRPAYDASLDAMQALTAPGSRVAFTYVPPDYGNAVSRAVGDAAASFIGEPLAGLISERDVETSLASRGFRLESDDSAVEWSRRYWPENERRIARPYERLAVACRL
jgi:methyltransferase (TIGR00027 family)